MKIPHARLSLRQLMILVAAFALVAPCFSSVVNLAWLWAFGHSLASAEEVLETAWTHTEFSDPKVRREDYETVVQWVGGGKGAWEVHFTHKVTRRRKCLRLVEMVPYGAFVEIKCPPTTESTTANEESNSARTRIRPAFESDHDD
jgi:hypothetical protein